MIKEPELDKGEIVDVVENLKEFTVRFHFYFIPKCRKQLFSKVEFYHLLLT
jgi:hypothetical protein